MSGPSTTARLSSRAVGLLVLGLAIREVLSFWTGHPFDLESFVRTGFVVAHGGSPYVPSAPPVPGVSFGYLGQNLPLASYPPFWPELLGGLFRLWSGVGGGDRFALYFLLKQPGIVADLFVAYLLRRLAVRFGAGPGTADSLLGFWMLLPYSIAVTAIWGQFDSIILALLLAVVSYRSTAPRGLLLGLAALAKWITVVFVPLELFRARGVQRLAVLVFPAVLLGLGIWPFLLQHWSLSGFSTVAVYEAHGDNAGMNYVYILSYGPLLSTVGRIPYLYAALGFLWVPVAVLAGAVGGRWAREGGPAGELRGVLLVVAAVLLVRWGLYEQYFLYLFGLAALDVAVFHPGRRALLTATMVIASAQFLANNELGLRFLTPVDPGLLNALSAADAGPTWGVARTGALLVLSVLMTITLVEWVRVYLRDEANPRPWVTWPLRFVRAARPRYPEARETRASGDAQ